MLLLSCWLGYRLYPYDLVLDVRKFRHGIRPLMDMRGLPDFETFRHLAIWLAVALLIEAVAGSASHRWIFPLAVVPGMIAARSLIWPIVLSPEDVAGGVLAALLWAGFLWRAKARAKIIGILFTIAIVCDAFSAAPAAPFQLCERRPSIGCPSPGI